MLGYSQLLPTRWVQVLWKSSKYCCSLSHLSSPPFYFYMFVFLYMHMCVDVRGFVFPLRSLTWPGVHILDYTGWSASLNDPISAVLAPAFHVHVTVPGFLIWVMGIELMYSYLTWQVIYQLSHHSAYFLLFGTRSQSYKVAPVTLNPLSSAQLAQPPE